MINCNVKYFDVRMPRLEKIEIGDWIDLRISKVELIRENGEYVYTTFKDFDVLSFKQFSFVKVYFGFAMHFPNDLEGHVVPRGSLFKNTGFIQVNNVGIIDHTYCGDNDEWMAPLFSLTEQAMLEKYQRICQFRLIERMDDINFVEVDALGNEDRDGHGSTGKL